MSWNSQNNDERAAIGDIIAHLKITNGSEPSAGVEAHQTLQETQQPDKSRLGIRRESAEIARAPSPQLEHMPTDHQEPDTEAFGSGDHGVEIIGAKEMAALATQAPSPRKNVMKAA